MSCIKPVGGLLTIRTRQKTLIKNLVTIFWREFCIELIQSYDWVVFNVKTLSSQLFFLPQGTNHCCKALYRDARAMYEGCTISPWLLERWCSYRKYVITLRECHLISVRIQSFKSVRWLENCLQPVEFSFWRIIINPRFINSYIALQKFLWITLKHDQTLLRRKHTCPFLWSAVSKRGAHLADSFLMPKNSCKMYHTRPTEMFTVSLISRTFNRRSLSRISLILSIISWEVTSFGRLGRSASLVLIRPQRNSVNH